MSNSYKNLLYLYIDIDECTTNTHDCTKNEECVNEIGTFSCYELFDSEENTDLDFDAKCRPGYKFNAENHVCDGEITILKLSLFLHSIFPLKNFRY